METLPKFGISRTDMLKRVARFKNLKGSDGGLPDSRRRNASARFITSSASSRRRISAAR